MASILGWVAELASTTIGTVGTVNVTIGMVAAGGMVASLAASIIKRIRRL